MVEFEFYGLELDWDRVFRVIFSVDQIRVFPDIFYPTSKAKGFAEDCPEFRARFLQKRGGFIYGAFTERFPPLQPVPGHGFRVNDKTWGPLIRFFLPVPEVLGDGRLILRPGSISHQSEFWSADCKSAYSSGIELKRAFAHLRKELKTVLFQRKVEHQIWVGESAWSAFTSHKADLFVRGRRQRYAV